ncbi:unnamed protein product [Rhizoctonia solani]|uniref:Uncharacterized protein n=1 Tax=Rhizoctonia solani TaxID=456999 RepID=A0A8H3E0N1_9AGAM|nr:unnamed protein product [Rhizoctonia solani]
MTEVLFYGADLWVYDPGAPRGLKVGRSLSTKEGKVLDLLGRLIEQRHLLSPSFRQPSLAYIIMARCSNSPRLNTFSFPIQPPVLHPPRLKRKTSLNNTSSNAPPFEQACMPPVRNHKRSNTLELPEVENYDDTVPQIRFKRKQMPAVMPLSPRSLNVELARGGKPGKSQDRRLDKKVLVADDAYMHTEYNPIEPPNLIQIFASPRTAALELSLDEPAVEFQNEQVAYQEPYFPDDEFYADELEELVVRAARARAQQRERIARRWENLCNARLRFLREQAIHNRMLAQLSAAACSSHPEPHVSVFPVVPSSPDSPSPSESFGAPLSRMSSPYATYGESIDLAGMASVEHRQQILSDLGSYDSRPLVDRIIECMDEFEYDEICVDGLSEAECRQLRTESRKRRRLDRQRACELGVLLELKRRQLGRSRSSSASSTSSDSESSSDSSAEPLTPPPTPLEVQSVDHLVAKMFMKRNEGGHRPCTSAITARAAFQARGCSSLRHAVEFSAPLARPRSRSESTKAAFSGLFSFSSGVFGLASTSWLKEKQRLTALDID